MCKGGSHSTNAQASSQHSVDVVNIPWLLIDFADFRVYVDLITLHTFLNMYIKNHHFNAVTAEQHLNLQVKKYVAL